MHDDIPADDPLLPLVKDLDLTRKERAFVLAYTGEAKWNATRAAEIAGFGSNHNSSSTLGWMLLQKVKVNTAIERVVKNTAMESAELLTRLGKGARIDLADFADCFKTEIVTDGDRTAAVRVVDWARVKEKGLGPFIKAVKQTKYGETLELIDPQRAQEMIGRALSLFTDKMKIEGPIDYESLTDEQLEDLKAGRRPRGV